MNKKGQINAKIIFGGIVLILIFFVLKTQGVFSAIITAFTVPELGWYGPVLGFLFVCLIFAAFLERLIRI